MRTFEALNDAVNHAKGSNDAAVLMECADELDALGTSKARAVADDARGWSLYLRTNYSGSLESYHRALAIFEELGDISGVAGVIASIGNVHGSIGNFAMALEHFHRALAMYEELGKRSIVATITSNIGVVYNMTGNYPAALEHFHRALAVHEELGESSAAARAIRHIGIVHRSTGNYPAALEHFHRALVMHEEQGESRSIAGITNNIGNVHGSTGNYAAALAHYRRALAVNEELGNRSWVAVNTSNIGTVYKSTGDYPAALEHFRRALAMHEELGEISGVAGSTVDILSALILTGEHAEAEALLQTMDGLQIDDPGNVDEAKATMRAALIHAQEHTLVPKQAEVHRALRELALKQNDLARYVEHNNEYTRITEEINGKDTATKLAMQEKQREIDAERKEHEKHMAVLHSTLPKHIADRVARGEVVNDYHHNAAVIFLDIVGFTAISDRLSSSEVVQLLESVFTALDDACKNHDVVKIKTIGDSYMAAAFGEYPNNRTAEHPVLSSEQRVASIEERAANAALDMLTAMNDLPLRLPESLREALPEGLHVRIGMHCGPVTAGVIGTARMQFDVWGDTVNVASRMESTSAPGRIHVSQAFANAIKGEIAKERNGETAVIPSDSEEGETAVIPSDSEEGETAVIPSVNEEHGDSSPFPVPCSLRERGALEIKGKGTMTTFWLERS
jgi:adenylate cyclase